MVRFTHHDSLSFSKMQSRFYHYWLFVILTLRHEPSSIFDRNFLIVKETWIKTFGGLTSDCTGQGKKTRVTSDLTTPRPIVYFLYTILMHVVCDHNVLKSIHMCHLLFVECRRDFLFLIILSKFYLRANQWV